MRKILMKEILMEKSLIKKIKRQAEYKKNYDIMRKDNDKVNI